MALGSSVANDPPRGTRRNLVVFSLASAMGGYADVDLELPPSSMYHMDTFQKQTKGSGLAINRPALVTSVEPTAAEPVVVVGNTATAGAVGGGRPKQPRETLPTAVAPGVAGGGNTSATEGADGWKQRLSRTQKRNRKKALKKQREGVASATPQASGSRDAVKRSRDTAFTPSPAAQTPAKKPRDGSVPTFKQVVTQVKIALIKRAYPEEKLTMDEVTLIQMKILNLIDQIPDDNELPTINAYNLLSGALILQCEDGQTATWLKSIFDGDDKVLRGFVLKAIDANELPKPVKVAFKTRDIFTKDAKDLLRRLKRFNRQLNTEDWRILQKQVETQSVRWIFEVDSRSVEAIKKANFVANTGVDRGIFKIIHDPNRKTEEVAAKPGGSQPQVVVEPDIQPQVVAQPDTQPQVEALMEKEVQAVVETSAAEADPNLKADVEAKGLDLYFTELGFSDSGSESTLQPPSPMITSEEEEVERMLGGPSAGTTE